jgi:hypothetical protein
MVGATFAGGEIKATLNSATNWMTGLDASLAGALDGLYTAGDEDTDDALGGIRFLSRATNISYLGNDAAEAAKAVESAARFAELGAVPQTVMAAAQAGTNAVNVRANIAIPQDGLAYGIVSLGSDGTVERAARGAAGSGAAIWFMPLYQKQSADGMKAGQYRTDWKSDLGGVAIGADYTFASAVRAGLALNVGGGSAKGRGDLASTSNSFDFWGIGAYAGFSRNNFGFGADFGYTATSNDVEQTLHPALLMGGNLKSDISAYALSFGLKGEYLFETGFMDIAPYAGLRFTNLRTGSYDAKAGALTVFTSDSVNQNVWTFPVGVVFSKIVETGNGWYFKPSLDLSIIPAAGDVEYDSVTHFTGVAGGQELASPTRIMDRVTYQGGLGVDFGSGNLNLGLNYTLQLSNRATNHGLFGMLRYEF